ncbi:hypothetical protein CAPTEDRAFT_222096 [Capitella teleta]|uniref:Fibrous sheath-interacting protein 1 n=1 Tax=Capitella teleta TaxID=283909 RepID=R7TS94_CAPTE|nr:hypothetical protein CAPTEDRAFT_222096 [Capitella teleta]|eukprot:ELT93890.1 hypothetical protein CAPTEDRAFT_222096 [Capitella teleta]
MSKKIRDRHQMNIEFRGDLEDISRPTSNRQRPGPPKSNNAHSSNSAYCLKGSNAFTASLELLSPEEIASKEFDLALEDLDSSSETSEDDGETISNMNTIRTSDIFHITEPAFQNQREDTVCQSLSSDFIDEDLLAAKQLALFEDETDTEIEVGSDEEQGIIAEIKAEITNQVRGEMQEELGVYREAKERLNREKEPEEDPLEGLDPKVKDAILRMRKLDKVLEKKIRREKAVKKDRILLQRRLRKELEELDQGKKSGTVDEKRNMEKFLALALPPSHSIELEVNELDNDEEVKGCLAVVPFIVDGGVLLDDSESECVTPVFQTQVPEDESRTSSKSADQSDARGPASAATTSGRSQGGSSASSRFTGRSKSSTESKAARKKRKDFIKRNMELAGDAANTIAMTDDEKHRIEGLLSDLEVIPEMELFDNSNPYQIVLSTAEGFRPSEDEIKRLDQIDDRLRALLPPEDFNSICSTPLSTVPSEQASSLFTHSEQSRAIDYELLGERALKDNKEHRDLQQRLNEIEQDLTAMTQAVDREMVCPTLSEEQLQQLLDQCARTMTRASAETELLSTSRSGLTAEQSSLYDNPPKLPDHVLQELLADARMSLEATEPHYEQSSARGNSESLLIESVNEDTMKELLQNPRTTSRMSRDNSLTSMLSSRSERRPFLPEIDPKGTMSTQKLSDSRPRSGNSGLTVHNQLGENVDHMTPRPPSDARKSGEGRNRSRNSFDN